jgi:2-polyprenyl-3-methyl-5-hydroxy-6-metoxy-1,4-benzoquinol methylase
MNAEHDFEAYFQANQKMWDEWAAVHMRGNLMYPVEQFKAGKVGWTSNLPDDIGPVAAKSILHLQCHFGLDTLLWARQGAHVTGVDFSETAVQGARALNDELGMDTEFVQSNLYALPDVLEGEFDIVLTYYGVLPWLPDLRRWAEIVAYYLKPGGFVYIADMHPFVDMIEGGDPASAAPYLAYTYFSIDIPQRCDSGGGTYAVPDAQTVHRINYQWKHRMGDIVNAVAGAGLRLEFLREFPYTFCDVFDWPQGGVVGRMEQDTNGWWRLARPGDLIPLMFSLKACKEK